MWGMLAARNRRRPKFLLMFSSAVKLRTPQCICSAGRACKALFNRSATRRLSSVRGRTGQGSGSPHYSKRPLSAWRARAPLADRRLQHAELLTDRAGRNAFSGHQHDASVLRNGLRRAPSQRHLLQLCSLPWSRLECRIRKHFPHRHFRQSMHRKPCKNRESCKTTGCLRPARRWICRQAEAVALSDDLCHA
jgi:hypothetical protein